MAAKRKICTLIGFAIAAVLITPRIAIAALIDPRTQLAAASAIETRTAPINVIAEEINTDINDTDEETRAEPPRSLHTITPLNAHSRPKTRVMGSDLADPPRTRGEGQLTLRMHWGINYAYGRSASRSLLGAGGAPIDYRGAGPTISPGPLGYAGMVPGGLAATAVWTGLSTSAETLNNLYGGYGLLKFGYGVTRWGVASLVGRLGAREVEYAIGDVMANGNIAGVGPGTDLLRALPNNARSTMNVNEIFGRLADYHGVNPIVASERLHAIKAAAGRGAADNVLFDFTGNVYDPSTRLWLGTLTAP